jgi:Protein of unknown function (DUF998)
MVRKALLVCGILSSLLYIVMNILVPMQWAAYSLASQTVSELSAIGAPTRPLWIPLGIAYTLLVVAFGLGVWKSAARSWYLQVLGALLVISGIVGLGWPPMHQREVLASGGGTLTDTLHLVWAGVTTLFFMLEIGFGAAAFGKLFRVYSIVTMGILVAFGILTGLDAPGVSTNLPTPWIGVWERINIGVFMVWVIVLAIALLRIRDTYHVRAMKLTTAS